MSKPITLYFDFLSPYTYLANTQLKTTLAADIQEIHYIPVPILTVMERVNNSPTTILSPAKGQYAQQDLVRWARRYQVPFARNPYFGKFGTESLCLVTIAAQQAGCAEDCIEALFQAMWIDGVNLGDDKELLRVLNDAGIDDAQLLLDARESETVKQQLQDNIESAVNAGVFGSPSFVVEEQLFFGNDRLDFVKEALVA